MVERDGIRGALAFLNGRVPHRFTGLYRFDPPQLRNVLIYDELNPTLLLAEDARMEETYCSVVGRTEEPFWTDDAMADPRLEDHPARGSVRAYTGVLLEDAESEAFGTLCHFDVVPRPAPREDVGLMQAVAHAIRGEIAAG